MNMRGLGSCPDPIRDVIRRFTVSNCRRAFTDPSPSSEKSSVKMAGPNAIIYKERKHFFRPEWGKRREQRRARL
jgi:hypothetical protein